MEGGSDTLLYLNRPCETLVAPGNLRVVVRYHLRQRVLTLPSIASSCVDNPVWVESGRTVPGLRFGGYSYSLEARVLGQREWKRTFRVDTYWNGRRLMRGWFQVTHARIPPRRIYENDDPYYFHACEVGQTGPEYPIYYDREGRRYCIKPGYWSSSGRSLKPPPKKRG